MLLFSQEITHRPINALLKDQSEALIMNDVTISALKEFGNILVSAYLSSLGNMLTKTLIPSVPLLAYDITGTVVDYVLIELSKSNDQTMLVETGFTGEPSGDLAIKGHFLPLPDPSTLEIFLNAAGGR